MTEKFEEAKAFARRELAFQLTRFVLEHEQLRDAVIAGAAQYMGTDRVTSETSEIEGFLSNTAGQNFFQEHRGLPYVVWGYLISDMPAELRTAHPVVTDALADRIREGVYNAYSNSGASGTY